VGLIIISTYIPASPTADKCGANHLPTGFSTVSILIVAWFVIDLLFHAGMVVLQLVLDARLGIRRPWYCPIIPIVSADSTQDVSGAFIRLIMFLAYCVLSGGLTLGTILYIGLKDQVPGCDFGKMTCKAAVGCTASALAMCRKLNLKNCDP